MSVNGRRNGPVILSFPITDRRAEAREARRQRTASERRAGRIGCILVSLCLMVIYFAATIGYYRMHVGIAVVLALMAASSVFCLIVGVFGDGG